MGQKINPTGFRLIINKNWSSVWYANRKDFSKLLAEDLLIRKYLQAKVGQAGIDELIIARSNRNVEIELRVARPGLVIGRGGSMSELIKKDLDRIVEGRVRLNVQEVSKPNLSAKLVMESIVGAIERKYPYKRAVNSALKRVMDSGAKGIKVFVSGRLGGNSIARLEKFQEGAVPTSTMKYDIKFARGTAHTKYGTVGIKVWINVPMNTEQ
jgi:small subunit ribosomal protein S3